jgi:hypothetical protein
VFFLPQLLIKKTMTGQKFLKGKSIVILVWGFALCYFAFWM